jgi:hypothetical protein
LSVSASLVPEVRVQPGTGVGLKCRPVWADLAQGYTGNWSRPGAARAVLFVEQVWRLSLSGRPGTWGYWIWTVRKAGLVVQCVGTDLEPSLCRPDLLGFTEALPRVGI